MNKLCKHRIQSGKLISFTVEKWESAGLDAILYTKTTRSEFKEFEKEITKKYPEICFVSNDISAVPTQELHSFFKKTTK